MKTFLTKIKDMGKSFHNFCKINPYKQWMTLLYTFFVIVFICILSSFYLLYEIKNDKIFQVKVEQVEKKSLLKEDLLKKTINLYDTKFKKETDLISNPPVFKDPSL
ncbi:hypothetical protein A2467_01690 [Candidatus Nomurabacteria bacterium RIFOXYC2_FULL_36_8]|nr:MAG: hypothetical protein US00_C0006G0098 [Candidatus Nomurabacteria bacterium GW2011_GWF2_36_126]KKP97166.1 MAG: hypothetical protein US04_C0001G0669 [Candidatus Nomurabacteria bacterium GW2011_GWD2_36_14]KKQ09364.1 MAG: hypothetical protein US21_C0005G0021 [Candidatus Nomurabacteria bacterium GW2011_GWB1_36_6]KKQ13369.1 MAG: hypothetical protein US26_C0001G0005 [Candidatus Nomurabacteria bacterium GW2011_GWE1_36_71]KKQ45215.1 MAG: hypothetical protein US64_C0002G0015 [Candidatus Nomurabact